MLRPCPPITVIIPCYCCRETVERALDSVLNQTLQPPEVLLVDDACVDGTLELLRYLEKVHAPRVKVITLTENVGPGLARNAGWDAATQPWLAFLDADDAWHPRKLEIQWAWLKSHPEVVLCGHASQFSSGRIDLPVEDTPTAIRLSPMQMLISNRLPTRSVMLRRELPFRFREKRFAEDYQLWLEIILARYPAFCLDSPLAYCFRPEFSSGGLSGQLWMREKSEIKTLRALYATDKIHWWAFALSATWSFAKFLRRLWLMRRMR